MAVSADNSTVYTVARGGSGANEEVNNGAEGAISAWMAGGAHSRTVTIPSADGAIAMVSSWDGRLLVVSGGSNAAEPDEFDLAFAEAAGVPAPTAGTSNELYIFSQDL